MVFTSDLAQMDISEGALGALRSEDISMTGNEDNFSTVIIAHTQTEAKIETETPITELSVTERDGLADKPTATMTGTVRSSSDDTLYRYCSACRQKHCCSFP